MQETIFRTILDLGGISVGIIALLILGYFIWNNNRQTKKIGENDLSHISDKLDQMNNRLEEIHSTLQKGSWIKEETRTKVDELHRAMLRKG